MAFFLFFYVRKLPRALYAHNMAWRLTKSETFVSSIRIYLSFNKFSVKWKPHLKWFHCFAASESACHCLQIWQKWISLSFKIVKCIHWAFEKNSYCKALSTAPHTQSFPRWMYLKWNQNICQDFMMNAQSKINWN